MGLNDIDDLLRRTELLTDRIAAQDAPIINELCSAIRWLMVQLNKTGDERWSI